MVEKWKGDKMRTTNKTRTARSMIIIGMFFLHTIAAAGWSGELVAWGRDLYGRVINTPVGNDFVAVAAGPYHNVALKSDGSLVAWGRDDYGQVSNTPTGNNFVAVAAGTYHSVAIKSDGSLVSWGQNSFGQVYYTPTGNNFEAVSAGEGHSVALKSDGSLVAWGLQNVYHQVSDTPTGNNFVAVASGPYHNVALKSDGSLVAWGYDGNGEVSKTPAGNNFVAVTAGFGHNVAVKSDGSLVAWGYDGEGEVSKTPSGNNFAAVAAGLTHSVALKSDGSLIAWGYDGYGQVSKTPTGTGFVAVSVGYDHSVAIMGTVSPPPTTYTLTTNVSPSSSGSVTKYPNKSSYSDGESVQLTATANSGYTFSGWSGNASGSTNPITITMNSNKSVTANFTAITKPTVSIVASDSSAGEPSNDGAFTVTRTGDITSSLRVYYSTAGSTASSGADYAALPGYVDIQSGQSSAVIYVVVIDDTIVESSETVQLTISSNSAYTIGSPSSATVTITDNDNAPPPSGNTPVVTINATDASAGEPSNNGYFIISRTGDTSSSLRVYYSTAGSTASAGADYTALPGYVDIFPGQYWAVIYVIVIDDSIVESSETVQLTISSNAAYAIGSPSSATVTIADNDTAQEIPIVTITATNASAAEPANNGSFTVSRTGAVTTSLRVYYSTSGSTATSGTDYIALPGYVDIPAGQSSAVISVSVIDDAIVESSETVQLTISSNAAYAIGSPSYATVTITDNDNVPPPPTDNAEQMMADTLTFFYASVDDGSLVGVGKGKGRKELTTMQSLLETAYNQIAGGDYAGACGQLTEALSRCDGLSNPTDYVTGSATATLANMIRGVITELGC
jgi:uncharacterized repeat protein (TIGR02543 family)